MFLHIPLQQQHFRTLVTSEIYKFKAGIEFSSDAHLASALLFSDTFNTSIKTSQRGVKLRKKVV
jgi:hypothetical protein